MREMTRDDRVVMKAVILHHLRLCMDSDSAIKVDDSKNAKGITVMDDVMDDIKASSAWEDNGHYNDDDVRLAIGRVMTKRLGVEL